MSNQLSISGAKFIRLHEGFIARWYLDPVGVPTIGIGFTFLSDSFKKWWKQNKPGVEFKRGASMTREEAESALQFMINNEYGKAVNKFLGKKVPQHVYDGMVSPVYNLGPGSLKWKWAAACKRGDYAEGANRLKTTGVTARGKKLAGLVRRRKEEAILIKDGVYTGVTGESYHKPPAMADGVLERGEAGPEVGELIEDLHELGFYDGVLDDVFGYGTEAAVLDFQEKYGLKRDGRAGPKTLAKIAEVTKKPVSPKASERDDPGPRNPKSNILPLYRPKQSDPVTLAVLDKFSNLVPESRRGDKIKVLVVRGYYLDSMGRKGKNDRAIYDDAIFVCSPEGVQPFNGNSDPSVFRRRVATIKAPQAVRYRPGLHGYSRKGGPYPAFRQDANATVVRDQVGEDHGMFHVNLHRGGTSGTSSLGCLTVPTHQWDEFYNLLKGLLDKHKQSTFYATIVEYPGDNPPVVVEEPETAVSTPAVVAAGGAVVVSLVASWWDQLSTWLGGLF